MLCTNLGVLPQGSQVSATPETHQRLNQNTLAQRLTSTREASTPEGAFSFSLGSALLVQPCSTCLPSRGGCLSCARSTDRRFHRPLNQPKRSIRQSVRTGVYEKVLRGAGGDARSSLGGIPTKRIREQKPRKATPRALKQSKTSTRNALPGSWQIHVMCATQT